MTKDASDDKVHIFVQSGAGADAVNAPIFKSLGALRDYVYRQAELAYVDEVRSSFAGDYEVDVKDPDSRWLAAAKWCAEHGRGEWCIVSRGFSQVVDGKLNTPQADPLMLDEAYVESLRGGPAPAAG